MKEAGNGNALFSNAALEHLDALYGFAMTLTVIRLRLRISCRRRICGRFGLWDA
jgi:hypothetical protein